jgi:small subunit ribosomal protein S8
MNLTDPIADMLTRIRNAQAVRKVSVEMPLSRAKLAIAAVLLEEGYIGAIAEVEPLQIVSC